ncbi:MAG TPA: T9SS type A sorting domain-containing protein, partial [Flavobacteriales bacterium]|nr:T9SS type A sorting domain-containing protein [Flavobacteriales bacterium]
AANGLVRLNTDGSRDLGFDAIATAQYGVLDVIVQSDGHILFCGAQGVDRVTSTGGDDPTFDTGSGFFGGLQVVVDLEVLPDGRVLAGGQFDEYDGHAVGSIVRLTSADVGVGEEGPVSMKVWPNPSPGSVCIRADGTAGALDVRITDMSGREVERMQRISEGDEVRLPAVCGTYIVEARTNSGVTMRLPVLRD